MQTKEPDQKDPPQIDSYHFGTIVIDGQNYTKDVIIYPDRIQTGWWRKQGHSLSLDDLDQVMHEPPEVLVIGQGANGLMDVPTETRRQLEAAGIEVKIAQTDRACQLYNRLRGSKVVVAALHLTC